FGIYSATALLPGEDAKAFDRLHRALKAELAPDGALEEEIVRYIARLLWRKQNLATIRAAERAGQHRQRILSKLAGRQDPNPCIQALVERMNKVLDGIAVEPVDEETAKAWETARATVPPPTDRELLLEQRRRETEDDIRKELGASYELVAIGKAGTFEGLAEDLDLLERIDGMIDKCLKRLLHVRGLKAISAPSSFGPQPRIPGPAKAA